MPECFDGPAAPQARHAGTFDCLMTSLILITMDNGRGHCAHWQSCKVPNQTHRGMKKIRKMYAIKQIKICAEYRDMLLRPRLDLSGTPGLRPIGLSPGSWQTSLGLGSMSRYSAQSLICITNCKSHTVISSAYRHILTLTVRPSVKCVPNTHKPMTSHPSRDPNCNCNCSVSKCFICPKLTSQGILSQ